jgi:hypothetical protein
LWVIGIHFLEKIARLSSSYISREVYHEAGNARTAELLLLGGVEPPRPRYPRNDDIVGENKPGTVRLRTVNFRQASNL